MEDNSYVSLSLEKYNELYDKAKKFDEITEKMTDDFKEVLDKALEAFQSLINNEETAATEEVEEENSYYDVELIIRDGDIPAGAKGKCLEPDNDYPYVDWDKHYDSCYEETIDGVEYKNVYSVDVENLKKVNEKEGK